MTDREVIFVDLDGTLICGNSMKVFMKRLPGMLLCNGKLSAAVASLWWMSLRVARIIDHRKMKWHLTRIARKNLSSRDWESVANRLARMVNPRVEEYLNASSNAGCKKYIATAAMSEYAEPLGRMLKFDSVLATVYSDDILRYKEMRGEAKCVAIQNIIKEKRLRMKSFLTDHYDDIPTARVFPANTLLVNPSQRSLEKFCEIGVTSRIL